LTQIPPELNALLARLDLLYSPNRLPGLRCSDVARKFPRSAPPTREIFLSRKELRLSSVPSEALRPANSNSRHCSGTLKDCVNPAISTSRFSQPGQELQFFAPKIPMTSEVYELNFLVSAL
jgi:hypothetical protein